MNYAHEYHAGNFADVAKHVALLACLHALRRKERAFFVLDTHAGAGLYDLRSSEARKSGEADAGVRALGAHAFQAPCMADYLAAIGARPGIAPASYAGSPLLIARALRPQDRAVCVESEPSVARALGRNLGSHSRIRIVAGDAYEQLKALLPPPERRGLVLIDPCYEERDEARRVAQQLAAAHQRWATGVYLLWYPIREARQRAAFHAQIHALRLPKTMFADLAVRADDADVGLAGSGLILVNPPFGVPELLRESFDAIHRALAGDRGYVEVGWLVGEG